MKPQAHAWIAAYDLTNNSDYLDTATGIFGNLSGAWPTACNNGGIPWCADQTYINAIANELFLSLAAHLANRCASTAVCPYNSSYYIDWAQQEWAWFQSVGLINAAGVVVDGLGSDCVGNASDSVWSYNQGVVLGGLVELAAATANATYLADANALAAAAIANLTDATLVVHDAACEPACAPDATQFKGIFLRNLQKLQLASPAALYEQVIRANADSVWLDDRLASNDSLSVVWSGPFVGWGNASTHSSAMDALVAAVGIGLS